MQTSHTSLDIVLENLNKSGLDTPSNRKTLSEHINLLPHLARWLPNLRAKGLLTDENFKLILLDKYDFSEDSMAKAMVIAHEHDISGVDFTNKNQVKNICLWNGDTLKLLTPENIPLLKKHWSLPVNDMINTAYNLRDAINDGFMTTENRQWLLRCKNLPAASAALVILGESVAPYRDVLLFLDDRAAIGAQGIRVLLQFRQEITINDLDFIHYAAQCKNADSLLAELLILKQKHIATKENLTYLKQSPSESKYDLLTALQINNGYEEHRLKYSLARILVLLHTADILTKKNCDAFIALMQAKKIDLNEFHKGLRELGKAGILTEFTYQALIDFGYVMDRAPFDTLGIKFAKLDKVNLLTPEILAYMKEYRDMLLSMEPALTTLAEANLVTPKYLALLPKGEPFAIANIIVLLVEHDMATEENLALIATPDIRREHCEQFKNLHAHGLFNHTNIARLCGRLYTFLDKILIGLAEHHILSDETWRMALLHVINGTIYCVDSRILPNLLRMSDGGILTKENNDLVVSSKYTESYMIDILLKLHEAHLLTDQSRNWLTYFIKQSDKVHLLDNELTKYKLAGGVTAENFKSALVKLGFRMPSVFAQPAVMFSAYQRPCVVSDAVTYYRPVW